MNPEVATHGLILKIDVRLKTYSEQSENRDKA